MIKDRQGDFDGAAEAMERCKRSHRMHEAPHWKTSERVHSQMRELMDATSGDDFQRWRDESGAIRVASYGAVDWFSAIWNDAA